MATHLEELAKKKKKKKRITLAVIAAIVVCGIVAFVLRDRLLKEEDDNTVEIVVEKNQTLEYGQITELIGNEMVYKVANRYTTDEMQDLMESGNAGGFPGGGDTSGGGFPGGDNASGGGFPGGVNASNGGFPAMGGNASGDASSKNKSVNSEVNYVYMATNESVSVRIPVSAEVTTKLGTVTTFSRLGTGDTIGIVYETDDAGNKMIVRIYILQ